MKKIIFILMILTMFVSCSNKNFEAGGEVYKVSDFIDLECVARNHNKRIYVDKNTGVLYYFERTAYSKCYTPIYNVDGTLKNISQYDSYKMPRKD